MSRRIPRANGPPTPPQATISQVTPPKYRALIDNDGVVYSSPTSDALPSHIPSFPPVKIPRLVCYRSLGYFTNEDFYLAFVPYEIDFTGPLLRHLDYEKGSFPLRAHENHYALGYNVGRRWYALEYTFQRTVSLLMRILAFVKPPDFKVPIPHAEGYMGRWSTREEAQQAAWRSREAFIGLCALMSFLIAGCKIKWPPDQFWCHALREIGGEDPTYINLLSANRFLSDHSPRTRRIGVMVDVKVDQRWHLNVPTLIESNIPMWFRFCHHREPPTLTSNASRQAIPSDSDVRRAIEKHRTPDAWDSRQDIVETTRRPDPSSGQRSRQTWKEFFASRDAANAIRQERATAEQREKWKERRNFHDGPSGQTIPGLSTTSPATFVWISTGGSRDSDFYIRKRLKREDVDTYWYNHCSSERIYDPITNTWDLCRPAGLGVATEQLEDTLPQEDEEATEGYGKMWDINVDDLGNHDRDADDDAQLQVLTHVPLDESQSQRPVVDEVQDILRDRYSFVGQHTLMEPTDHSPLPREKCCKILVHREGTTLIGILHLDPQFPDDLALSMCDFVTALSKSYAEDDIPFCALNSRLCPRAPPDMLTISNSRFKIQYLKYTDPEDNSQVEEPTYWICPLDPQERGHWDLFVDDPLTALQIIRSGWGPSIANVATELVTRGMRFNTFLRQPDVITSPEDRAKWRKELRCPSLGHSIELNSVECYRNYVDIRNRFLRENSHARVALSAGGIVWRLAIDALDPELVLEGPSPYFEWSGRCRFVGKLDFWDDDLTTEEMDLICGVYTISLNGELDSLFYAMMT